MDLPSDINNVKIKSKLNTAITSKIRIRVKRSKLYSTLKTINIYKQAGKTPQKINHIVNLIKEFPIKNNYPTQMVYPKKAYKQFLKFFEKSK